MIKINEHINLLKLPRFEYPHCNCLWIEDDRNCLIDSSPQRSDIDYLVGKGVDLIVNSHGHIDHYRYNGFFPGSKILMHEADSSIVQSGEKYLEEFGFLDYLNDPVVWKFYLDAVEYQTTRVDGFIKEGDLINTGKTSFEVLHLPGHSAGHCGFLFPESGFIFTGDISLSDFGPWYGNMRCSLAELIASIDRVMEIKPDFIVTGHGDGIVKENYREGLVEFRDFIYQRQKRIVHLIHRGINTLEQITCEYPVYIKPPLPLNIFHLYEKVMVLAHLRYLVESGAVFCDGECYSLAAGVTPSQF